MSSPLANTPLLVPAGAGGGLPSTRRRYRRPGPVNTARLNRSFLHLQHLASIWLLRLGVPPPPTPEAPAPRLQELLGVSAWRGDAHVQESIFGDHLK